MSASEVAHEWTLAPAVLVGAGTALALFAQAFWRLRHRGGGERAPWTRAAIFTAAIAAAVLALVSPLDTAGEKFLLSAHMLQHVVIGDLVPALALVALRGPLVFFLLPAPVLGRLARLAPLRRALGFVLRPRMSLAAWAVVIAVWHIPRVYDSVLTRPVVHDLEHVSFLVVGLLVWYQLVDPARRRALPTAGRIGYAVVLFAFGLALADVLVFSFHPLYGAYAEQPDRLWEISPLTDQRLAGVVMMVEQLLTLGTCIALILVGRQRAAARVHELSPERAVVSP